MIPTHDHISVCICTYKRSKLLVNLLKELQSQITDDLFTYSIVVVDNDHAQSAKSNVFSFKEESLVNITYHCEPEQNLSLARNKAVQNAKGNFIAFIDDDETPTMNWLIRLYKALDEFNTDGVLGPVVPDYKVAPPKWVVRGKFYERPSHKTGEVLHWTNTRTGNTMLRRAIFDHADNFFGLQFGRGGEDRDFFRRMINKGFVFVWCEEAIVFEEVPPHRLKRWFMIRRAIVRGQIPHFSLFDYIKSFVAIPTYAFILPFLLLIGHHIFMKYLISAFDHIGRILALCGIDLIKEKYIVG